MFRLVWFFGGGCVRDPGSRPQSWTVPARALLALVLAMNDAEAREPVERGAASDPVPLVETDVQLREQQVELRAEGDAWRVSARYELVNQRATAAAVPVGLPEYHCAFDRECDEAPWQELRITVGGNPIKPNQTSLDDSRPWADYSGVLWTFDVEVPARGTLGLTIEYTLKASRDVNGTLSTTYVTRFGPSWKGPIDKVNLTLRLPPFTHTVFKSEVEGLTTSGPVEETGQPQPAVSLSYRGRNWEPTGGLELGFNADVSLAAARRDTAGTSFEDLFKTTHCASLQVAPRDVLGCRQLYYAAKGYPFKTEALRRHYYGTDGRFALKTVEHGGQVWVRGLKALPSFTTAWFDAEEQAALARFAQLERSNQAAALESPVLASARSEGPLPAPPSASAVAPPLPSASVSPETHGEPNGGARCGCRLPGGGSTTRPWELAIVLTSLTLASRAIRRRAGRIGRRRRRA